jgi:hypothetical protein
MDQKMLIISKKLDQAKNSAQRHHMRRVLRELEIVMRNMERGRRG